MSSRRTCSVPKDVFPRMLYCDSSCSQMLTGLSPAHPGALLWNATRRLGDWQLVILHQRVWGSVRAVRAVRNTRVFQTETRVLADEISTVVMIWLSTALKWKCTLLHADFQSWSYLMTNVMARVIVDVYMSKATLIAFNDGSCFTIAATIGEYLLWHLVLRVVVDGINNLFQNASYDCGSLRQ